MASARAGIPGAGFPARVEGLAAPSPPFQPPALSRRSDAAPAAGIGLDSERVRLRMVQRLRSQGVSDEAVLGVMARVPRHRFVDSAFVTQAYEDTSLPIGHGQTISKPVVVARMLALLAERFVPVAGGVAPRWGRVLEIGTGCGYQAALLAWLARSVVSVERIRPLHEKARAHLDAVGAPDVRLVWSDGRDGHAPRAPYDAIIAAAGGDEVPSAWLEQLAPGGRLVAPSFSAAHGGQVLVVIDRDGDVFHRSVRDGVQFVPLRSGVA